jgi:hypothetical protein
VGTVIQDMPHINHRRQPRWDRFERADLLEQYRALRHQGLSERQAAKELEVPRTTLQAWRVPFLGLQALPPALTDFEIRYFFSYTAKERAAIFSRYGDSHRLAVALQIGMIKMTGRTLDAFETVPPPVLRHLQTTLQIPTPDLTSLRALYQRRSTLHEHQAWATQLLDFRPLTERRQRALLRQVRHEALKAFTLNHVVEFAKRWLYERRILIPADRRVRELAHGL